MFVKAFNIKTCLKYIVCDKVMHFVVDSNYIKGSVKSEQIYNPLNDLLEVQSTYDSHEVLGVQLHLHYIFLWKI